MRSPAGFLSHGYAFRFEVKNKTPACQNFSANAAKCFKIFFQLFGFLKAVCGNYLAYFRITFCVLEGCFHFSLMNKKKVQGCKPFVIDFEETWLRLRAASWLHILEAQW